MGLGTLDVIGAATNISEQEDLDFVSVKVVLQLTKIVMLVHSELVQMPVMQIQVSISQCGNFRKFLPLRFYVKTILDDFSLKDWHFDLFQLWNFLKKS